MGRKYVAVGTVICAGLLAWWAIAQESPPVPEPTAATGVATSPERPSAVAMEELQARIRSAAEASGLALLRGDDARVVEFTYPRVVEQLGGREAMLVILADSRRYMAEQGVEFRSYTVDTTSDVYAAGDELHAVVRTIFRMQVPGGLLTQPGFLLAVSNDGGETWRFVDGAQLNAETVLEVVPAFNPALELPAMLEPTLERIP